MTSRERDLDRVQELYEHGDVFEAATAVHRVREQAVDEGDSEAVEDIDSFIDSMRGHLEGRDLEVFDAHLSGAEVSELGTDAYPERALLGLLPGKTRRLAERNLGPSENVQECLVGGGGQAILALNERLLVLKAGFMAGATFGGKATSFPYEHVTGIEVQVGPMTGFIQIQSASLPGQPRRKLLDERHEAQPMRASELHPYSALSGKEVGASPRRDPGADREGPLAGPDRKWRRAAFSTRRRSRRRIDRGLV
jgi:hypothetical protein